MILCRFQASIQNIARQGKEKRITCCAVWCNNFIPSFSTEVSNYFAVVVAVAVAVAVAVVVLCCVLLLLLSCCYF